jgi:hypothetical protein
MAGQRYTRQAGDDAMEACRHAERDPAEHAEPLRSSSAREPMITQQETSQSNLPNQSILPEPPAALAARGS